MCAQIKERKVKEKYSKERGWRVRDRHTQMHGGREREARERERVWQVKKRWWEDKEWRGGVPPQRETFGEEEDELKRRKLKSETGGVKRGHVEGSKMRKEGGREQKTEMWSE